ncbi:MAG: YeeE/YedE family protein [Alphaproteobacteria bacterium]|nr:YeeE/YedE family protein [Alphaproteobacteria bacterium]
MPLALSALAAGILFGLGLAVSQMTNPAKVLAFLDVTGAWDPSLAIVMAAALAVFFAAFRIAQGRPAPLLADAFKLPARREIDAALVAGSVLFGAGWGLAGLCPAPAITALISGQRKAFLFLGAMLVGMLIYRLTTRRHA